MSSYEKDITSEVEPNRLYQMCEKLTEAARQLKFAETPAMLQIGFHTEHEVAEKSAATLLTQWRELAASSIETVYPHGIRYDTPGLKQSYFAVELLYIATLVRWGLFVEAEESIEGLLPAAESERDVIGIGELLEEVLAELQVAQDNMEK